MVEQLSEEVVRKIKFILRVILDLPLHVLVNQAFVLGEVHVVIPIPQIIRHTMQGHIHQSDEEQFSQSYVYILLIINEFCIFLGYIDILVKLSLFRWYIAIYRLPRSRILNRDIIRKKLICGLFFAFLFPKNQLKYAFER